MKRVCELFSYETLLQAFYIAYRGRKKTSEVIQYHLKLEENLCNLRARLYSFIYVHSHYSTFVVNDSKKRVIHAPCFEDHIVHHCVYTYLEEIFDSQFIFHSYANRKDKGTHRAVLALSRASVRFTYFLKMDISKYFKSISQDILFMLIQKKVTCTDLLCYVHMIIYSFNTSTQYSKNTGIPIGAVTSQLFANIYLHELDRYVEHYIKTMMRKRGEDLFYVRYVDDFIFLGFSKESLLEVQELVLNFLQQELRLHVHPSKQVLNTISNGIPFLGYVIFRHRLKVRNDTLRRFKRRVKKYDDGEKILHSLMSFKGHISLTNTNLLASLESSLLLKKR